MILIELARLRSARTRTNERDPKPSPGSRRQPTSTFLLSPAHTSIGEDSRTKVQNVVADSLGASHGRSPLCDTNRQGVPQDRRLKLEERLRLEPAVIRQPAGVGRVVHNDPERDPSLRSPRQRIEMPLSRQAETIGMTKRIRDQIVSPGSEKTSRASSAVTPRSDAHRHPQSGCPNPLDPSTKRFPGQEP